MMRLDLTVIILTLNEELHIRRCLENVCDIAQTVYVIDCYSKDKTQDICKEYENVEVMEHIWPGNQAAQFNWALDNLNIETPWVLRLDADEYLSEDLKAEIQDKLPCLGEDVGAIVLPLGRVFHGRRLKYGTEDNTKMIRLFRKGCVRYENRVMDEHLNVLKGKTIEFEGKFIDESLISMRAFIAKHNGYSDREAAVLLDYEYGLTKASLFEGGELAEAVKAKRKNKEKYANLPLFHRAIFFFLYRYIIRGGFLDGKQGFVWHFFQGLWYRMLIDAKVAEARRLCGKDKEKIRKYINDVLGVKL